MCSDTRKDHRFPDSSLSGQNAFSSREILDFSIVQLFSTEFLFSKVEIAHGQSLFLIARTRPLFQSALFHGCFAAARKKMKILFFLFSFGKSGGQTKKKIGSFQYVLPIYFSLSSDIQFDDRDHLFRSHFRMHSFSFFSSSYHSVSFHTRIFFMLSNL